MSASFPKTNSLASEQARCPVLDSFADEDLASHIYLVDISRMKLYATTSAAALLSLPIQAIGVQRCHFGITEKVKLDNAIFGWLNRS